MAFLSNRATAEPRFDGKTGDKAYDALNRRADHLNKRLDELIERLDRIENKLDDREECVQHQRRTGDVATQTLHQPLRAHGF